MCALLLGQLHPTALWHTAGLSARSRHAATGTRRGGSAWAAGAALVGGVGRQSLSGADRERWVGRVGTYHTWYFTLHTLQPRAARPVPRRRRGRPRRMRRRSLPHQQRAAREGPRTASMCCPQPAQVILPQPEHVTARHMVTDKATHEMSGARVRECPVNAKIAKLAKTTAARCVCLNTPCSAVNRRLD